MLPFKKSTLTSQHNIKLYHVGINELSPIELKIHMHISKTYMYQKISISHQFRPGLSFGPKMSWLATYIAKKNCFIKINAEADEMANVKISKGAKIRNRYNQVPHLMSKSICFNTKKNQCSFQFIYNSTMF